jgi:ABC-2 type transport system ATP-binding protein
VVVSALRLTKRYGSHVAVRDLSFEVGKGDVVGFLGPNGAGKSTTLRILTGFLGMTSGSVKILGHDIETESFEARQAIGYMPEAVPLYPEMRVAEYLTFRAELKQISRSTRRKSVGLAMEKANVSDVSDVLIANLSKGYRQRVGLADALVASPPLLILDEPTAGLDPNQIREVRDVIRALGKEHTVLLSTHILSEVEASCGRVIVIAKGRLVAEGTTAEIQSKRTSASAEITVRGDFDQAAKLLSEIDGVKSAARVEKGEGESDEKDVATLRVTWPAKTDARALDDGIEHAVASLVASKIAVREVVRVKNSLEEVFRELTRSEEDVAKESAS